MAYTGSGTSTDPYIVDNWTDLKSLISSSNTSQYIALDPDSENKVMDLNDYDNAWLTSTLYFYHITGNGWTIRNLCAMGAKQYIGDVTDLTFENFAFASCYWYQLVGNVTSCKFSGLILNAGYCWYSDASGVYVQQCSFNLDVRYSGGTVIGFYIVSTSYFQYNDAQFNVVADTFTSCYRGLGANGSSYFLFNKVYGNVTVSSNAYIGFGKQASTATHGYAKYNVVALSVSGSGTVAWYQTYGAGGTMNIVDTSIISEDMECTIETTSGELYALTTEQMQDPDYLLNTVGFPCVLEE